MRRGRIIGMTAGVTLAAALVAAAPVSASDDPTWTSMFSGGPLANAGWAACPEPIRVSLDTRNLDRAQSAKVAKALDVAMQRWNASQALTFAYAGEVPLVVDGASMTVRPEDGVERDRWVYLTVVHAPQARGADAQVVGVAGPLRVDTVDGTIHEGSAAFRAAFVIRRPVSMVAMVFTHELGHVVGLGHSSSPGDVMHPVLRNHRHLGAGDLVGLQSILKPCPVTGSGS